MSLAKLETMTVAQFPASVRRPAIFADFMRLHSDLVGFGLVGELWVDGSFMTAKEEPDDVDLSFMATADHLDGQTPDAWSLVNTLHGRAGHSPLVHAYLVVTFAMDDPRRATSRADYWAEKWNIGWDDYLKGIAVVRMGESSFVSSLRGSHA